MFIANIQTLLQIFELYGYNYQSLSVSLSIHLRKYSNWMAITIKLNKNCDKHRIQLQTRSILVRVGEILNSLIFPKLFKFLVIFELHHNYLNLSNSNLTGPIRSK
jgi:hypothetical protein